MADWDTVQSGGTIPNGHILSNNNLHHQNDDVDPTTSGESGFILSDNNTNTTGLPYAYSNPAFRHSTGPVLVTSDRFTRQQHLMENHLVYDKQHKNTFLDDTEKRQRINGSIAVRRVYNDKQHQNNNHQHINKYATTRIPNESVMLNPIHLTSMKGFQNIRINPNHLPLHHQNRSKNHNRQTAPVMYRSRSKSPRQPLVAINQQMGSAGTFRRHRASMDTKEDYIAFFDIETEKVEKYQYRPGEEVSGAIKIIAKQNFEIRFVELVVVGQGHLTIQNPKDGLAKTLKETYLYKHTYVIGTGDSAWTSVLTAGHYTSKFRVKLPAGIPSSFYHEDTNNGFTFEVKYTLMARICDDATRSSVRSTASVQSARGLMRVILAKKTTFQVQRSFDIHSIPNSLDPVVHKEQLWLSCAHQFAAIVSVQLDRSVFLAGDDIRMQLTAALPGSHRVKDITCSLQEHITVDRNYDPLTFTLSRMMCKDPEHPDSGRSQSNSAVEENTYDVTIPTQTNLISSFAVSSASFKVSYSLAVHLKFSRGGGKLTFKVPIEIGPCAEPIYADKTTSGKVVPLFNRTTRFPCFSPTPPTGASTPRQAKDLSTSSNSIPVETKYSNGVWSRCFLCCFGTVDND